jgi:hypothetical protein
VPGAVRRRAEIVAYPMRYEIDVNVGIAEETSLRG